MRKNTLLTLALFFCFSAFSFAQSELIIEVRTDNNPEETNWVLYDILENTIEESIQFEKETTYRDTMLLDDTKCYFWTIYDSYGNGLNGGINPGDYNVWLNGNLIAECDNPDFGDSISVYTIGTTCSTNDVGVKNMTMLYYLSKDNEDIKANIVNMGVEPITSLELFYTVDDLISSTEEITGLSIQVGEMFEVVYPIPHNFTVAGDYNVELTVAKVNGEVDANDLNNSANTDVNILDGFVQYNVIEDFMSVECGPCYDAATMLDGTLEHFDRTQSLIKYMVWDFADTKYFETVEELADYYRVSGVPHIRLNGEIIQYLYFTPTYYQEYIGQATPVKLTVNSEMIGDSLITNIKVISNEDINTPMVLRLLPMENTAYDVAINWDNKDPFHNVVYDIFNGAEGIAVESLEANNEVEFTVSNSIVNYPFEEGSFEDMAILVYLQEIETKKIHQSNKFNLPFITVEPELTYNIENEAIDVDTASLEISLTSNRHLLSVTGKSIGNINDYFKLKKDSETGVTVPFEATINENSNFITVLPKYGWELNSTYYLFVDEFRTIDGIIIPQNILSFTTFNGLGVNDNEIQYVQVYPNPAKDILNITSITNGQVEVVSITGQVINNLDLRIGQNSINISNYNTGIYFLKVNTNVGTQIIKFIKH